MFLALKSRKIYFLLLSLAYSALGMAQREDTIYLYNGDRITGEIVLMSDNKLTYKTDRAGTIIIEWPSIAKIYSPNFYKIFMESGEILYGTLNFSSKVNSVSIQMESEVHDVKMSDILVIDRIKIHFKDQLSASIFLNGFYTKANQNLQLNTGFDLTHKNLKYVNALRANAFLSTNANTNNVIRNEANYTFTRFFDAKSFASVITRFQQNSELNIAARYQLMMGSGRYFIRKPAHEFNTFVGISVNSERSFTEGDLRTSNFEIGLGSVYHRFKFRNPKVDLFTSVIGYKSINVWARFRYDLELILLYELVKDLNINITLFNNYDNRPPGDNASIFDWNVTAGLTYKIN